MPSCRGQHPLRPHRLSFVTYKDHGDPQGACQFADRPDCGFCIASAVLSIADQAGKRTEGIDKNDFRANPLGLSDRQLGDIRPRPASDQIMREDNQIFSSKKTGTAKHLAETRIVLLSKPNYRGFQRRLTKERLPVEDRGDQMADQCCFAG